MFNTHRIARLAAMALAAMTLGGCSQAGSLGNVLGSVLGGQQGAGQQGAGQQVSGMIQSVDTRSQRINLRQSNGQTVALGYDNQTQIVYQNKSYGVTSLEYGDQVTARVQSAQNGYYTDLVQVDQPVAGSNTSGTSNSQLQTLQGTVRRIDQANGWFEVNASGNVIVVSLPYNTARADQQKFQNLRNGDVVRFTGVYLNNNRVELRQFY